MAIAAVVALLILIIDDFINFMKGNDSVIGKLFEKAGIDADKARAAITKAWGTVVSFLTKAWKILRQAGTAIWGKSNGNPFRPLERIMCCLKSSLDKLERFSQSHIWRFKSLLGPLGRAGQNPISNFLEFHQ